MYYRPFLSRIAAHYSAWICSPYAWVFLLSLCLIFPGAAQAAGTCGNLSVPDQHTTPSTSPMVSGGSIQIDTLWCHSSGLNPGGGSGSHGTYSVDASSGQITYVSDGQNSSNVTDTFTVQDDALNAINVTVSIAAKASSITVSPSSLPAAAFGVSYSQTLSATGGSEPYTFALSSGALPNGMSFSNNTLSGTPTQAGTFNLSFSVTDKVGATGSKSYSLTVGSPTITLSQQPSTAFITVPYSFTLAASGGNAPYTYALHGSDTAPPGLVLSSNGTISGTPTTLGSYSFRVDAVDSSTPSNGGVLTINLTVANQPPTAGPVSATVNYDSTNNPITLALSGPVATSVAVDTQATHGTATASGTSITYTPTTGYAGLDTFKYTASNGAGASSPATVTVTVNPPTIVYAPTNPPNGTVGALYNQPAAIATASGGAAPYSYTIVSGALPAGVTLATDGTLNGTPTAGGTFTFQVKAADSSTGSAAPFSKTSANLSLVIAAPTITLAPATLTSGNVNVLYSQTITASGGTSSYTYALTSGALPTGITLTSAGVLSGTTSQAGSFPITITATDSTTGTGPFSKAQNYTLTIAGPNITLAPASLPNAMVGTSYGQTLTASGGTGPYTFAVTQGVLPPGMALTSTGSLSGAPTTAGDFSFTVVATDTQSFTGSHVYTVHVAAIAPGKPTGVAATAGAEQATVSFSPPTDTGGAPITSYTVTSSPGGKTGTGTTSPIVVSGLTDGTPYTFTVVAINTAGPSPASDASNSVTPRGGQTIIFGNPGTQNFGTTPTLVATSTSGLSVVFSSSTTQICSITSGGSLTFSKAGTCIINADQSGNSQFGPAPQVTQQFQVAPIAPSAPDIGTVTAGDRMATVHFTAPVSSGGVDADTITYTATSNPAGGTGTSTSAGSITVTGLTNGTPYTFIVTATNTAGGTPSLASSPAVTPKGPQTITFDNPGGQNFGTSPQLNATSTSGLQVAFTSVTTSVCTVTASGVLTTVSPGNCTIHADQIGNNAFLPATQVPQSFDIVVPGGAVSLSTPSPLPVGTGGTPYPLSFVSAGGAAPYSYTETGALPTGLSMTAAGVLSGTPTSAGTFSFTVTVTDKATQTAQKTYQLTINAPGIALAPSTLPQGKVGTAYTSTTVSASGGSAPYSYAVTSGALPAGLTLSPAGVVSGSPTAAGSFNITVTATDKFNFQGARAYTIVVDQPTPIAVNYTASVNANGSATIPVTNVDTGPITSLTITQQPAHGTTSVSGLNIVYTPAHDYFGSDTLKYTATGPGGTSGVATVTISVVPGAVPVVTAQSATVLAGKSVTIHAVAGATNGPFTTATLVSPPSSGTAVVQGTDIVYTADANASGTYGFDFTLSNAFGTSQPAHATVTVNARPVAQNLTASVIAGTSVQVDLTTTAHGGPFTGAKVVSVSPANAGTATVQSSNGGYKLSFTAAPTFGGMAQISYTLSNAFATSDPATISVSVTARSDPSKNAEVLGVLDAQADSTRRMATGQISNFQRRLESLHGGGGLGGFSNGITMTSASSLRNPDTLTGLQGAMDEQNKRYVVSPDAQPAAPRAMSPGVGAAPGDIAFWTGGAVNFGKMQPGTSDNGIDFTTSGVSFGADKQIASKLTLGVGAGYGHDVSDVGQNGSRSSVDSYNFAFYGSYQPTEKTYIDAVIGYQWLQFDARRYVTDNGNTVHGSRDGKQLFGSFSVGYQHQTDDMLLTPYGRLDIARASLDGYTETGDSVFALDYQRQTVKTSTATLGVLAQWTAKRDYGTWAPQLRAEFGHDMQGSSQATMRYADLINGPLYQATLIGQSRNHTMLGAGVALQMTRGWLLRAEYQNYLDNTSKDNQSILFGVEKKFDP
jgi:large repetitive protein